VASRFNEQVTSRLVAGAREGLLGHGVREEDLLLVWVPGSFELPLVARTLAASGRYQAVICLGAVIKGETAHFEYIAAEAARGIAAVSRETGVPVIFGVLTTYNLDQALARSGGEQGNRGYNAALTALQMANLLRRLHQAG
jgi:6,7-dimethyl-8-ribityllumazine synthase